MAIIENRATEIGDIILINTDVPVIGIITLTGFLDSVGGENGNRFFKKEFRYSNNGVTFSNWLELTTLNISGIQVDETDTFFAEYRYIRQGTSESGDLTFNSVELSGDFEPPVPGTLFDNSVFGLYFDRLDVNVLNWAINVLEKIYNGGLIHRSIERTDNFIDFWKPVCIFFAYLVYLSRIFRDFGSDVRLLSSFLKEKGIKLRGSEDITDLRTIAQDVYKEISKRGGLGPINLPDGEFRRMIDFIDGDEFYFVVNDPKISAFNIDNSSPEYRGNFSNDGFNKIFAYIPDNYPIVGSDTAVDITGKIITISNVADGDISGIGDNNDISKLLAVDTSIPYEFSCEITQSAPLDDIITIGVRGFNLAGVDINLSSAKTGSSRNDFIIQSSMNIADQKYFLNAIIYPVGTALDPNSNNTLGIGDNLIFTPNVRNIIPYIVVNNDTGSDQTGDIIIENISIAPILKCGKAFLDVKSYIDILVKNNNTNYTDDQIRIFTRDEFIPIGSSVKINFIE
jgi:hypothetical protein